MRVSEIRIYPVKGFRGVPLRESVVEPWGLAGDRRFMVTDPDGHFLTQRQHPRMAVIAADLTAEGIALSTEGRNRIAVVTPDPEAPSVSVTVWRDTVSARDCGNDAADWLSDAIGTRVRLVHLPYPAQGRPVDPAFSDPGDVVTFADGFPLLVTTLASLGDLEARRGRSVGMDRFRANIVVEGAAPWAEDGWQRLRVGSVAFDGRKDCAPLCGHDRRPGHRRTLARHRAFAHPRDLPAEKPTAGSSSART